MPWGFKDDLDLQAVLADEPLAQSSDAQWNPQDDLSDEEFEGAYDEKAGVHDDETTRWPIVLAQMQSAWAAAVAEAASERRSYDAEKEAEDAGRSKGDAERLRLMPAGARGAWLKEAAACAQAARSQRRRWRRHSEQLFEEIAAALRRAAQRSQCPERPAPPLSAPSHPAPPWPAERSAPSSSSRGSAGNLAEGGR